MAEHHAISSPLAVNDALLKTHPELAVLTLELPDSDGKPLGNERAGLQIRLILDSLAHHWRARQDFYSGGNMFVYYSVAQARQLIAELAEEGTTSPPPALRPRHAFRGPDVFVVLNVDGSYRRQKWVVWAARLSHKNFTRLSNASNLLGQSAKSSSAS